MGRARLHTLTTDTPIKRENICTKCQPSQVGRELAQYPYKHQFLTSLPWTTQRQVLPDPTPPVEWQPEHTT